jgi:hypothetical protein
MTEARLVDMQGNDITLPYHTTYRRDDNGQVMPCVVAAITSPPNPSSPIKRMRERGAITVRYAGGPPYYGADPASLGLRIEDSQRK